MPAMTQLFQKFRRLVLRKTDLEEANGPAERVNPMYKLVITNRADNQTTVSDVSRPWDGFEPTDSFVERVAQIDQLPRLLDVLARNRLDAYSSDADPTHLIASVEYYRTALDLQPSDRAGYLCNLASCFLKLRAHKADVEGRQGDLQEAGKYLREAIGVLSPTRSGRAVIFGTAASVFSLCFESSGQEVDLDDAILCLHELTHLNPEGVETLLCTLGDLLLRRFYLFQRVAGLTEAIVCYKRALQTLPDDVNLRTTCLNNLARALLHLFRISQSASDINEAVEFSTQALTAQPTPHPDRASSLDDLASALRLRYHVSGDTADLDMSMRKQKESLELTPLEDPDRPARLSNLALCLLRNYQRSGEIADLEQSITHYREVLHLQPAESDSNRPISLNDLATALGSRFEVLQSMPDLDEAISLCKEAVLLCASTHHNRPLYQENLTNTLRARYRLRENPEDLHATIDQQRILVCLLPAGDTRRPPVLIRLGDDLSLKFATSNELEDLDNAITSYKEANRFEGHDPTDELARALSLRFDRSRDVADLDQVIELLEKKLSGLHVGPESDKYLASLALPLYCRSQLQSDADVNDLDRAIKCQKVALQLHPLGPSGRAASLLTLSGMLLLQFDRSNVGKREDIDEVVTLRKGCLELCSPDERPSFLVQLADALRRRFKFFNEGVDIDQAVSLAREAAGLNPKHRTELAISLFEQFRLTDELGYLDESASHLRSVLAHIAPDDPEHLQVLDHLVGVLGSRFRHSADMAYLEEALMHAHTALDSGPAEPPYSSVALGNLADCLLMRYEHLGQISDLQDTIKTYRLVHIAEPEPRDISTLMNMAYALVTSFRMLNRADDLEEGLTRYRAALQLCDHDNKARQVCLGNLANALRIAFHHSKHLSDVDEAIAYYRQALDLCAPQDYAARSLYRLNFGTTLQSRFLIVGNEDDLDAALLHLEDAEDKLQPADPLHAISQFNLGTTLWFKYRVAKSPDSEQYARALALLESATRLPHSSVKSRFEAALQWTAASRYQQHPSTIRAYSCALSLLEKWMIVNPEVEAQHRFLATDQSRYLACDGASAAIERGDLEAAVELLEHGRTVLWSRLQGYRQSLDELRLIDSDLAERFESLSKELESLSLRSEATTDAVPTSDEKMKTQRLLSEEWDEAVSQIRQIDGFAHFLQPTPYSVLADVCSDGPVILINVSKSRSDAIILIADHPPTLVPLPNVSLLSLVELCSQLHTALESRDSGPGATRRLVSILRVLWTDVVQPITHQLQAFGIPRHSRIWWCPTSYLCGLPFHAAGSYRKDDPQPGLQDLFVSSYTPTLSALIRARNATRGIAPPEILVVGQSERGLPAVEDEIRALKSLGPFVAPLVGKNATRQNVRTSLERYPWVHFACHANQGLLPFQSSFELYDGRITLLELIRSRRPNAQLAFLSACNTATGDLQTPDETLHLAAALQFSGFQSVVGTLWPMADKDGPHVAREFYQHLFRLGQDQASARDSAVALSKATKYLRKTGVPLDRWINFVHIGA
ncbi:CHAT domain-containing protein [Mycena metata]|uniref:CHAT domain-containing protein n=1 Tax=Mycena metata TaxID=1033252 RepID=A0AAD7HGY4_9AGAR|nr:CHAT domain-containing protein [Mycena metata]